MDMSFEELKKHWQEMDQKMEDLLHLNASLVQELTKSRRRTLSRKYSIWLTIELVFTSILYYLTARYLANHFGDWSLFLPIASVHALLILSLCRIVWVMNANAKMDWQQPVVEIKRRYAQIGKVTRAFALIIFLYFMLMHTPLMFWWADQSRGYNAYLDPSDVISDTWVLSQWILSPTLSAAGLWLVLRHRDHPWMKKLISDSAGLGFMLVEKELRELRDFERDNGHWGID